MVGGSVVGADSLVADREEPSEYLEVFQPGAAAGLKPRAPNKKTKGLEYIQEGWGAWRGRKGADGRDRASFQV